jgi:CheY-like chemotaxis protein
VADTGIGIGREDQRSIFEPFEQSRGQKQRVYGGTGLGLSITSRLAKMMGGELSVSSVPDEGSVFVVDLPRVAVVATPAEDSGEDAPRGFDEGPRFPGGRVLVVDDNAMNRQVLAASLDSLGVEVRSAVDGEDCLARFRSFRPDLLLLDLLMPGLSGEEVALRIRGGGEGADTPVVACTAVDLPQAKEIAARAGIDDILVKPVSQKALARVLGKHLRRAGAGADGSGVVAEEPPPPVVDGAAPGNLGEVVRRLEEDFAPEWDQLRRRLRIAPILRASENLKALGSEHEVSGIVEYAEELRYWIGLFDVEKLKEAMDRFPDLLERYRARLPGEEVSP